MGAENAIWLSAKVNANICIGDVGLILSIKSFVFLPTASLGS